jgi:predicted nucleic acid-binding protein
MVLVDTPIWSLSLRRRAIDLSAEDRRITKSLYELVRQNEVRLLGSTRQEVLSGIREESVFVRIRDHMRGFSNVEVDESDYEEAARTNNRCRRAGVASSPVDCLMCAVARRYDWRIFTTDRDFAQYAKILPIQLFQPSD